MIKKNSNIPKSRTRSKRETKKKIVTDINFYFCSVWVFSYTCGHYIGIGKSTKKTSWISKSIVYFSNYLIK